jgi:hypothetical protein
MLREWGGPPTPYFPYVPPKSRPLYEQVDLLQRIAILRCGPPGEHGMTWDEIADAVGVPKRTLQHFYRSSLDGAVVTGRRRRKGSRGRGQGAKRPQ